MFLWVNSWIIFRPKVANSTPIGLEIHRIFSLSSSLKSYSPVENSAFIYL